jgi:hypothetical protein
MSSHTFRPQYKPGGWRANEPARLAAKKEAEQKIQDNLDRKKYENTETNFPTLIEARPIMPQPIGENTFATLATNWKQDDDVSRQKAEYIKKLADNERHSADGVFIYRRKVAHEEVEEPEPEAASGPSGEGTELDDSGWTAVSRKARKPKRELTNAELDHKYDEMNDDGDYADDLNGDLFDSKRHDHDRV